ncbi:hypothetical protein L6164_026595 [Bauhinia variegata]|uniref:Uncharacterized protein n=1 Tax=Bauhinia variegata TaxID=167791 RepID=A0ACB9LQM9_BAUVA|nr:hypothetical protein L6164_026595 [Bauhinia variegata]
MNFLLPQRNPEDWVPVGSFSQGRVFRHRQGMSSGPKREKLAEHKSHIADTYMSYFCVHVLAEMTGGGSIRAMISAFECVHDGLAVLVGVPNKDDAFKTHPINVLNEKTLKATFFGNYKPRSDLPSVVEMYMNKVS